MIRPVEQHERLHPKEYIDRVRNTEATPKVEGRDFSYAVRDAEDQGEHRQPPREDEQDRYEPSPKNQDDLGAEDSGDNHEKHNNLSKGDDGALDILA